MTSEPASCIANCGALAGLDERLSREAVETDEDVDNPAVGEDELVVNRVELPVEGCRLAAAWADGNLGCLEIGRRPTEFVSGTDLGVGPLEGRKGRSFFVERLGHEPERRDLSHDRQVLRAWRQDKSSGRAYCHSRGSRG
jgi:hypothetical protein